MTNCFFTADTHFGHWNICKYCSRPFDTIQEMDETIIANWNSVVRMGDVVYHLGDFAFVKTGDQLRKYTSRLKGSIHLIRGNHDRDIIRKSSHFAWQGDLKTIVVAGQKIMLSHYAMRVWNGSHRGSWCLCGHSHGNCRESLPNVDGGGLLLDVGVDVWKFKPISLDRIKSVMAGKTAIGLVLSER